MSVKVQIKQNKQPKFPLITYELCGEIWDKKTRYEMCIVSKWSDETEKAKEISRKTFYFKGNAIDAREMIDTLGIEKIYQYKEYTKFEKEMRVNYEQN